MNQTITIENFKCFAEKKRIDLGGLCGNELCWEVIPDPELSSRKTDF